MNSAREGWYVDPSTGTNLRYWNGTTWTDEVAPLPDDAPAPVEADLFAARADAVAEPAAETVAEPKPKPEAAEPMPEVEPEVAAEPMLEPAPDAVDADVNPPLDPDLEHTRLTRRELRARRGTNPDLDDAPKHLPPMTPPAASAADHLLQPEEVEIPIAVVTEHPQPEPPQPELLQSELPQSEAEDPRQRRTRIVRLSVLLGILAVASSVAVLTAGTL